MHHELIQGIVKQRKRLGRGRNNSKRAGAGNKGAKARNSGWRNYGIQNGGQNPLYRMHGKIGFRNNRRSRVSCFVDGRLLARLFDEKTTLSLERLLEKGLIKVGTRRVKILNTNSLDFRWKVTDEIVYSRTKDVS